MTGSFARINCCIPGCRRGTSKYPDGEIICGKCWRTISRRTKRFYRIAYGRALDAFKKAHDIRRQVQLGAGLSGSRSVTQAESVEIFRLVHVEIRAEKRFQRMSSMAWARCKREATEAMAGLR